MVRNKNWFWQNIRAIIFRLGSKFGAAKFFWASAGKMFGPNFGPKFLKNLVQILKSCRLNFGRKFLKISGQSTLQEQCFDRSKIAHPRNKRNFRLPKNGVATARVRGMSHILPLISSPPSGRGLGWTGPPKL